MEVSEVTATTEDDVVLLLISQHEQIKSLFSRLKASEGTQKKELFEDLVRLLAVHETAEEEVVHPTARRKLDHGEEVVDVSMLDPDCPVAPNDLVLVHAGAAIARLGDAAALGGIFGREQTVYAAVARDNAGGEFIERIEVGAARWRGYRLNSTG